MRAAQKPAANAAPAWRMGLILVLGLALLASAVAAVYAKYQSRTLFAQLQDLQRAQDEMDVEWGQLQLEQSTWAAHGRIEAIARQRLGMVLPEPQQVVVIRP